MDNPTGQALGSTEHRQPTQQARENPSLDELVSSAHELYSDTTAQIRGIGELAFMELELAIRSLQWGIWTLFMFGACSVMAGTFLLLAIALLLMESSFPPATVMLVCSVFSATAAAFLLLGLRSLTKRMTFKNLRRHLTQAREANHVEH
jgi:hypothetical protein